MDHNITIRQIINEAINQAYYNDPINYEKLTDTCIQKIKQKLSHLRRVIHNELETGRKLKLTQSEDISEEMFLPLLPDEILDILYTELDNCIEGLDYNKKDLTKLSQKEATR